QAGEVPRPLPQLVRDLGPEGAAPGVRFNGGQRQPARVPLGVEEWARGEGVGADPQPGGARRADGRARPGGRRVAEGIGGRIADTPRERARERARGGRPPWHSERAAWSSGGGTPRRASPSGMGRVAGEGRGAGGRAAERAGDLERGGRGTCAGA